MTSDKARAKRRGLLDRRVALSSRVVNAGCFVCNGSDVIWTGPNAVGVAARHHDATGHETWADQVIQTRYCTGVSHDHP